MTIFTLKSLISNLNLFMKNLFLTFVGTVAITTVFYAQAFHFNQNTVTLTKTTAQSPVHWYLEILSDVPVDTTLRWKASFENIPAEWSISFDDQNVYHTVIHHNDSSDFTLYGNLPYAQKLIIGAMLNDVAGNGKVHFNIYNPILPDSITTITYHFIISLASLSELTNSSLIEWKDDRMYFKDPSTTIQLFDLHGKALAFEKNDGYFDLQQLPKNQTFLIHISNSTEHMVVKIQCP